MGPQNNAEGREREDEAITDRQLGFGPEVRSPGRFGTYVPPVLEALGLAEVQHGVRNNVMRALDAAIKADGGALDQDLGCSDDAGVADTDAHQPERRHQAKGQRGVSSEE